MASTIKKWAGIGPKQAGGEMGRGANDNKFGPAKDDVANRANDALLQASYVAMQHGPVEMQKKFLLEGIVLLKQCGNAPWPPDRSKSCADVLRQTERENKRILK